MINIIKLCFSILIFHLNIIIVLVLVSSDSPSQQPPSYESIITPPRSQCCLLTSLSSSNNNNQILGFLAKNFIFLNRFSPKACILNLQFSSYLMTLIISLTYDVYIYYVLTLCVLDMTAAGKDRQMLLFHFKFFKLSFFCQSLDTCQRL